MLHADLSFFETLPDSALVREKIIIGSVMKPNPKELGKKESTIPISEKNLNDTEPAKIKEQPRIIPISRSTWRRLVKSGDAPAPVRIAKGISAWRVGELRVWLKKIGDA
jgi:predicted DNA-binding transcriptional regulator AlpA